MGKLPWSKVPYYSFAQYVGGFLGTAVAYAVYAEAILDRIERDPGLALNITTDIFVPVPAAGVSSTTQFFDQVRFLDSITRDRQ